MNKYKRKFKEREEFNGRKIDGVVFSVNTIKQLIDEGLEDWMIENYPGGGFNALDIQEMHIYNPYDSIEGNTKLSEIIWPSISVKNNLIILESAWGFSGKEDQTICKKVKIEL